MFFAADPFLWPDPIQRLKESVLYHAGYATSAAEQVYIDGVRQPLETHQTRLFERYRNLQRSALPPAYRHYTFVIPAKPGIPLFFKQAGPRFRGGDGEGRCYA